MLRRFYKKYLSDRQRYLLKTQYFEWKIRFVRKFRNYGTEELGNVFRRLGVGAGDTILLHSSFSSFNGYEGTPQAIIQCLLGILGDTGNLLMVSMPYGCSSYEYLEKQPVFDVRKTPSKMGILSEIFRRKRRVCRSLHPTHPVLAYGKDAAWIVEGHERCLYPCGKDTPFDKFRSLGGKVLFFDTPFRAFTFLHYIEDDIKEQLPFRLYHDRPQTGKVIDYQGREFMVDTYTFGDVAVKTRNPDILGRSLEKRGLIRKEKIGNTRVMVVKAADALQRTREMLQENRYFYDL
jgi:aminoglycoside 3-N-acetyltransferase